MNEVTALTAFGMPGVWTWGFTEGWSQFYADSVATNHNAIGRGYETFGNATAETVERWLEPDRYKFAGKNVTETDWYRSLPAPKKPFRWSLRDNTNYMETGVLAALQYAARNGPDMLRNFWRRGRNAVAKGRTEAPYAVVLPEAQDDKARLAVLVNLLRAHGIEVARATAPFTVKEGTFPAGTFVVKMAQPYRGFALDLLLPQKFPEKTEWKPYDDVSWELPASLGVEAKAIEDPAVQAVAAEAVYARRRVPGPRLRRGPRLPAEGHRAGGAPRGPRPPREVPRGGGRSRVLRRTGRASRPVRGSSREARGSPAPWTAPRPSSASTSSRPRRRRT